MNASSIHFLWFILLSAVFFLSLMISVFITFTGESFYVMISLFSSWIFPLCLCLFLDFMSSWFMTVVLLISSVIMVYSYFYMSPYSNSGYFLWFTLAFVFSMLLVITISNLFFVILGWDGLGLISFFLIVYYQNSSSIVSGLFTVIMNRIGDCFFILTIAMLSYSTPTLSVFINSSLDSLVLISMVIAFITNSAIFPFSPWLPIAMSAPTPISALVHSSTLVTAGLFLLIRFSYSVYSNQLLLNFLMLASVFTSFYAGLNAVFENDLNKLIALSTLSHLGFIGMAYSCGMLYLSFFHLLTHALFNSLLFIAMGDIIINLSHSQDIRFLSSGSIFTPSSFYIMYLSILNLLGMPSLSGFLSKDLILESLNYSNSSVVVYFMVVINLIFTYFYSYQLFYFSFQSTKVNPYNSIHNSGNLHSFLVLFLGLVSVIFGLFFLNKVLLTSVYVTVPMLIKLLPLQLNVLVFLFLAIFLCLPRFYNPFLSLYFSSMLFLFYFMSATMSNLYLNVSYSIVKSFELGALNGVLNVNVVNIFNSVSFILVRSMQLNQLKYLSVSFIVVFLIVCLFLLGNIILLYVTVNHNISLELDMVSV